MLNQKIVRIFANLFFTDLFSLQINTCSFLFDTLTAEIWKIYESSVSFQDVRISFLVFSKYSSRFLSLTWAIVSYLFSRKITSFGLKLTISSIESRTLEIIFRSWNVCIVCIILLDKYFGIYAIFLEEKWWKEHHKYIFFLHKIKYQCASFLQCISIPV